MPRPVDGKYRLTLAFPLPIGLLTTDVFVGPAGATVPFVSQNPLPYDPLSDLFGGGQIGLECVGSGGWNAVIGGVPVSGTCVGPLP